LTSEQLIDIFGSSDTLTHKYALEFTYSTPVGLTMDVSTENTRTSVRNMNTPVVPGTLYHVGILLGHVNDDGERTIVMYGDGILAATSINSYFAGTVDEYELILTVFPAGNVNSTLSISNLSYYPISEDTIDRVISRWTSEDPVLNQENESETVRLPAIETEEEDNDVPTVTSGSTASDQSSTGSALVKPATVQTFDLATSIGMIIMYVAISLITVTGVILALMKQSVSRVKVNAGGEVVTKTGTK
jgi:hypothetical protein